jgi:acetyl esterase
MTALDPDNQRVLDMMKAAGRPPVASLEPPAAREMYRAARGALQPDLPTAAEPLPVLVFYHGGGYVIGDLDTHDYVCRKLANVARCAVIAVDYRLAPEHKFPAAVDDAAAALRWIVKEAINLKVDASHIAVGGDSAGGNLSANMAHLARDGDVPPICFQMLLYPGTDMSMSQASYANRDWTQYPLSIEAIKYFLGHYLGSEKEYTDWRAAPLMAPNFKGLADAFVLTAGHDPLADEGLEYAKKLEANGVRVTFVHMSDQMHGFLTMGRIVRAADLALEMAGAALMKAFAARAIA